MFTLWRPFEITEGHLILTIQGEGDKDEGALAMLNSALREELSGLSSKGSTLLRQSYSREVFCNLPAIHITCLPQDMIQAMSIAERFVGKDFFQKEKVMLREL